MSGRPFYFSLVSPERSGKYRSMKTFRHIIAYMLIVLTANALLVLAIGTVFGEMIYFGEGRRLYQEYILDIPLNNFLVNWIAFPLIAMFIVWYLYPIHNLYRDNPDESRRRVAMGRLLNSPIVISSLSILAWLAGLTTMLIIYYLSGIEMVFVQLTGVILNAIILSILCYVFCYYALDALNRRVYIPQLFPRGTLADFEVGRSPGLRFRLDIFNLGVSIGPILIMTKIGMNASLTKGDSEYLTPENILILAGVLILLSLTLLFFLARFLRHPIERMRQAVKKIERMDFDVRLPITSRDEIAQLGEGINEMAAGLAEKEKIKDTFGRAVDPRVRDYLLANEIDMGGESREITVLFSDIRSFTSFSEGRDPQEIVAWLNEYFEEMSAAVDAHGGIVNKYIGDAVMAVFNAPLPVENHPLKALEAALDMLKRLDKLNTRHAQTGIEPMRIGIGIDTGVALAGNIGASNRLEYTVIGDVVNTASRVEGLCKRFNRPLLFTAAVNERIGETYAGEYVARGRVKGKQEIISVYTVGK